MGNHICSQNYKNKNKKSYLSPGQGTIFGRVFHFYIHGKYQQCYWKSGYSSSWTTTATKFSFIITDCMMKFRHMLREREREREREMQKKNKQTNKTILSQKTKFSNSE